MGNYLFQEASVYCSTYAKYNAGSLYGEWMRLADYSDYEEFCEAIKELHKDEEDPEFMFQDCENTHVDGEPTLSDIKEWYDKFNIETYDLDEDVVKYLLDDGQTLDEALSYNDMLEFKADDYEELGRMCADCLDIPSHLEQYFNYAKYGEDIACDFNEKEINGTLYFFR